MIERLKKIINNVMPDVDTSNVTNETRLIQDLQFDSLGMMMLAMAMEDEFGIHFDGPINFVTVGDVISYLEVNAKK